MRRVEGAYPGGQEGVLRRVVRDAVKIERDARIEKRRRLVREARSSHIFCPAFLIKEERTNERTNEEVLRMLIHSIFRGERVYIENRREQKERELKSRQRSQHSKRRDLAKAIRPSDTDGVVSNRSDRDGL